MEPVTAWWGIPCKSAIPVFRNLVELSDAPVRFVALNDLSAARRKLGWSLTDTGMMAFEILGEDWRERVDALIASSEGIHIVNGIYHDPRVAYTARRLAASGRRFGVAMEAPSNLATGVRRRIKAVLSPVVTPLRTRAVAKRSSFLLSASGARQRTFERLGFPPDTIYPYGYFPDFQERPRSKGARNVLNVLCIGYLKPFKGHDVLLDALAALDPEVPFRCVITGYGPVEQNLRNRAARLGIADRVEFAGVVSDARLSTLFGWAGVLAAPGHEEPWGIRVNEALLAGLPVVVSDGVGAVELVRSSGAGEVFRAGSASDLAAALRRAHGRLAAGELEATTAAFRSRVTPGAAAAYVRAVIERLDRGGPKPAVPWGQPVHPAVSGRG